VQLACAATGVASNDRMTVVRCFRGTKFSNRLIAIRKTIQSLKPMGDTRGLTDQHLGQAPETRIQIMNEIRKELVEISKEIAFSYHSGISAPGCVFYEDSVAVELGPLSYDQLSCPKALRFWDLLGTLPESFKVRVSIQVPDRIEIDSRFKNVLGLLDPIKTLVLLDICFVDGGQAFCVDTKPLSKHNHLSRLTSGAQLPLEPLRNLPLSHLEFNASAQEDLGHLGGMTTLEVLTVPENESPNCTFLDNLVGLKRLTVLVQPFYMSQLANLTRLESLSAYDVEFDIDTLRLKNLQTLFINGSNFEAKYLANCFPALKGVYLYNTVLESELNLRELSVLETFELTNSSVSLNCNRACGEQLKASEAKRLKELEDENRKLKEIVAEQQLDNRMLKHLLDGNS